MNALSSSPPVLSPNLNLGLLDNWIEGWSIALNGARDCFQAALTGGPGALNLARWMELGMTAQAPLLDNAARDRLRGPARASA